MGRIALVVHPYPFEILQSRLDESIITGQPMIERPFYFENTITGQLYYNIMGCVGWPTEISDRDEGMPGYVGIVGVIKPKTEGKPVQDAAFQLLAERENKDVPSLLDMIIEIREEYGFGLHPDLLQAWFGDYERFTTVLALKNERLMAGGKERDAILIRPPIDFGSLKTFDNYVRSLQSVIVPGKVRFYFGGCDILRNKLREFKRDCPAVMAVGGLIHSLLFEISWMDSTQSNIFTVEEMSTTPP